MVPVTCSTEGSNQVDTIDSVGEVHDTATAVHHEPTVDPINQAVEQLAPVQATTSIGTNTPSSAEVVSPMTTTTDVDPKASVQELDAISINASTLLTNEVGHRVVLNISSDLPAPALTTCSTKCSCRAAQPLRSVLYPAVTPSLPALLCTNIEDILAHVLSEEELQLDDLQQHHWPPPTPVQVTDNDVVLLHGIAHSGVTGDSGNVWWPPDHHPRRSKMREQILHTQLQTLIINLVELQPWPSWQPTFWVSTEPGKCCEAGSQRVEFNSSFVFSKCPKQYQWKVAWPLNSERKTTASRPCFMHNFQFHFRAIRPRSSNRIWSWTLSLLESVETSTIQQHVACNMVCLQLHQFGWLALLLIGGIPLCSYHYTVTGDFLYKSWQRQYNFSGHFGGILTDQFLRLWFLKQDSDDSCFSTQLLCEGKQWLLEICTCYIASAPEHHHSYLGTMAARVFQSMHVSQQLGPYELVCIVQSSYELCAQDVPLRFGFSQKNVQPKQQYFACGCRAVCVQSELPKTELPRVNNLCWPATTSVPDLGSVEYLEDLFLVIDEQSRKWDTTRNHACNTHEHWNLSEHHILEHATVCSIPMGDKLQRKIQLMNLPVHRKLLSQWKFTQSGHTVSESRQITQVMYSYEFQSNSVVFATSCSATRLASLQIDTWPDYLLSSSVDIPIFGAIFSGHKTVMLCSWVATLVQQHISKIFYGLSSSSSSLKSELLVRDVCGAIYHGFVIYINHQSDITNPPIAQYIGYCSLFDLHSDYLLMYAIDLMVSDMSINQLDTSWDPGELALLVLLQLTRRAVPQGGRGVIIVAAVFAQGYADHEYYLDFDRGCTENGYVLVTFFNWVSFGHNNYFYLVEVYPDSNQGQEHRVQWDPGGSWWRRLGVKPHFKEGGMSGTFPGPYMYLGWPLDITWAGPGRAPWAATSYKYLGWKQRRIYPVDHEPGTNGGGFSSPPTSGFFLLVLKQFPLYQFL